MMPKDPAMLQPHHADQPEGYQKSDRLRFIENASRGRGHFQARCEQREAKSEDEIAEGLEALREPCGIRALSDRFYLSR